MTAADYAETHHDSNAEADADEKHDVSRCLLRGEQLKEKIQARATKIILSSSVVHF